MARSRQKTTRGSLFELVTIVAVALGLALGIQAFLVKPFRIPSESMVPTLEVGQRVLVDRVSFRFSDPDRGDIVVFKPPAGADSNVCGVEHSSDSACPAPTPERSDTNFIKRVVAVPGDRLTGDALAKLYADITKKYYGHDANVCIVDDYVAHEWSYIPHFYRDFYVFQYATSFTASLALAEKVMAGDEAAKKRYLTFLSSGGSRYPIDLLKEAGVDMTTDEPLDLTIKKMNQIMNEMEKLLAKTPSTQR